MALVVNDRVKETSTTTGTGTFDLAGAATGFQTFVAGVGDTNTTYYAIFNQGTTEWEVGLGTVTDAATDTLARTTLISSSTGSAVDFAAGTKDVFCTLPASVAVFGKQEGTNFTDSLLVGHATTGTLSGTPGPVKNTGVGIDALNSVTTGYANTCIGFSAGTKITSGQQNVLIGDRCGDAIVGYSNNVGIGANVFDDLTSSNCTAVGYNSSIQNVTGSNNTSLGKEALKGVSTNSHSYNTAVGVESNKNVTTGGYNLTLGYQAGDNITSGSGNVVIGKADVSSATADDQLSISDGEDGSVVWMTGASTGAVEINEVWNPSLSTTGKAFVMGF